MGQQRINHRAHGTWLPRTKVKDLSPELSESHADIGFHNIFNSNKVSLALKIADADYRAITALQCLPGPAEHGSHQEMHGYAGAHDIERPGNRNFEVVR